MLKGMGEREKGSVAVNMKYFKDLSQLLPGGLNEITMKCHSVAETYVYRINGRVRSTVWSWR
jgi:hypothetical protein